MATDNVAVVRRYIEEVWNKGDLNLLGELVSDKFVAAEPVIGEVRGLDALRQQIQMFRTAFPDLRMTIEDIGTVGDKVFVRWTGRGTHKGMFMGIAPSNNRGEVRGMSVDRIINGKIAEHHESYDTLTMFQLMGVVSPLDQLMKGQMGAGAQQQQRRV
jgi:steroid delta-isomerase-like uncharacterized protein